MGNRYREKDEKGGGEDGAQSKCLSGCGEEDVLKYSRKIEDQGKGEGKNELKEHKDLPLPQCSFNRFSDEERTKGLKNQPVGKDDSQREFIALEGDEEFPQQDDLSDDPAQSHDQEGDLQG